MKRYGFCSALFSCQMSKIRAALNSIRPVSGFLTHVGIHVCLFTSVYLTTPNHTDSNTDYSDRHTFQTVDPREHPITLGCIVASMLFLVLALS